MPSLLDVLVYERPVGTCVMLTDTPPAAAPLGSETTTLMVDVVFCENAVPANNIAASATVAVEIDKFLKRKNFFTMLP
jgi:hypothetical protein